MNNDCFLYIFYNEITFFKLSTEVLSAIENNRLIIEKIHCTQHEPLPK